MIRFKQNNLMSENTENLQSSPENAEVNIDNNIAVVSRKHFFINLIPYQTSETSFCLQTLKNQIDHSYYHQVENFYCYPKDKKII